jgi:hypothetical protein
MKKYEGVAVYLHAALTRHYAEVGSQLRTPAALLTGRAPPAQETIWMLWKGDGNEQINLILDLIEKLKLKETCFIDRVLRLELLKFTDKCVMRTSISANAFLPTL